MTPRTSDAPRGPERPSVPRVAVIGSGYWGRNLVRNFHQLAALAAIHDADDVMAGPVAEQHGVSARSLASVLADEAIPAVAIPAPARLHFTLAREALVAGKHIFVEKPLALELGHAQALERLAQERGRTLMVGHLLNYRPAFARLEELVRAGWLGKLQYVYSHRLNLGRVRRDENILWSFAPPRRGDDPGPGRGR